MSKGKENYTIKRHDMSSDKSLQAWSAADEYLIQYFNALENKKNEIGVYNDRFGYLTCYLDGKQANIVLTHKSQEKAILANIEANNLAAPNFSYPLSTLETELDLALIKMPKSQDLFKLFLEEISHNSTENLMVVCGFMTKHFTPKMLEVASKYFNVVEQSKAHKKARLLILKEKKSVSEKNMIHSISYKDQIYKQYPGVFSGSHIDYATQFLLEHIVVQEEDKRILDLASGNGVIANEIFKKHTAAEIHLLDDSYLAVASGKLNIEGEHIHHHCDNNLAGFDDNSFDLIVSNPPFHFEYEVNIQITLHLFKECLRCLKHGGQFQIVANKHLNYKVHLQALFSMVKVISEDKKYIVYQCVK